MMTRLLWLPILAGMMLLAVDSVAAEGVDTYVVARGDALETIAQRFGTSVRTLAALNQLRNPDRLVAGQVLHVPGAGGASDHIVAPGDTLEDIAAVYRVSVDDLAAVNQLPDPDRLTVGQRLNIPGGPLGRGSASPAAGPLVATPNPFDPLPPYLYVPYRSQFDGTTYGESNCGPATLGMMMAYHDEWWSSDGIRRDVNRNTGDWSLDGGSSWESLVFAARKRGFTVHGLYDGSAYHRWTFDDLLASVRYGSPPMLLVRFRNLPGHQYSDWWGDHYIVFLGVNAAGRVVYHDSAFYGDEGAYRTMSKEQLMRAWSTNAAGIQYSAMVLAWHSYYG